MANNVGAALQYAMQQLGGPLVENESYPSSASAPAISLCNGAGDRVGLVITNLSSVDGYIALTAAKATAGQGILVPAGGGTLSMNLIDDFTLPTRQWYGATLSSTQQWYVLEMIRFTEVKGS